RVVIGDDRERRNQSIGTDHLLEQIEDRVEVRALGRHREGRGIGDGDLVQVDRVDTEHCRRRGRAVHASQRGAVGRRPEQRDLLARRRGGPGIFLAVSTPDGSHEPLVIG
ncbi:MAG: hypothetical protein ACK55I_18655, partial [bacterium]